MLPYPSRRFLGARPDPWPGTPAPPGFPVPPPEAWPAAWLAAGAPAPYPGPAPTWYWHPRPEASPMAGGQEAARETGARAAESAAPAGAPGMPAAAPPEPIVPPAPGMPAAAPPEPAVPPAPGLAAPPAPEAPGAPLTPERLEPTAPTAWPEVPAARLPEAAGLPQVGPIPGGIPLEALLTGRIRGLSERLLREHHRIYREFYGKFREVRARLRTADRAEAHEVYSRYRSLKVSETIAWNGVRLHELYFDNLGGVGGPAVGRIADLIRRDFGSFENWLRDFTAAAKSTRTWAMTVYDYYDRRLHTQIMDSNEAGHVVLTVPLVVCDMAEHAYMIDFGFDKDAYLRAFFGTLDWDDINGRLAEVLRGEARV